MIGKLKSGKAGGDSGILPEMGKVACVGEEFLRACWSRCTTCAWKEKSVPNDW